MFFSWNEKAVVLNRAWDILKEAIEVLRSWETPSMCKFWLQVYEIVRTITHAPNIKFAITLSYFLSLRGKAELSQRACGYFKDMFCSQHVLHYIWVLPGLAFAGDQTMKQALINLKYYGQRLFNFIFAIWCCQINSMHCALQHSVSISCWLIISSAGLRQCQCLQETQSELRLRFANSINSFLFSWKAQTWRRRWHSSRKAWLTNTRLAMNFTRWIRWPAFHLCWGGRWNLSLFVDQTKYSTFDDMFNQLN
jgi:hypothetical protein